MVQEGENGLLAEPRNPEALAAQIDVLLTNDELREKMGEHSRMRLMKYFSIEAYAQNYSRQYDMLIQASNH